MDKSSSSIPGMQQEFDDLFAYNHPPGIYRYPRNSYRTHPRATPPKTQDEDFMEINSLIKQKLVEDSPGDNEENPEDLSEEPKESFSTYFAQSNLSNDRHSLFSAHSQFPTNYTLSTSDFTSYSPPGFGNYTFLNEDMGMNQSTLTDFAPGLERSAGEQSYNLKTNDTFDPSYANNPYSKLKSKKELEEEKKKKLAAQKPKPNTAKKDDSKSPNYNQYNDNIHYHKKDRKDPYPGFHGTYNSPHKPYNNKSNAQYSEDKHENTSHRKSVGSHSDYVKNSDKQRFSLEKNSIQNEEPSKSKDEKKKEIKESRDSKDSKESKEAKEGKEPKESIEIKDIPETKKPEPTKEQKPASPKTIEIEPKNQEKPELKVTTPEIVEVKPPVIETPELEEHETQAEIQATTTEFISNEKKKKKKKGKDKDNTIKSSEIVKKEIETLAENKFMPLVTEIPEVQEKKKEPEPVRTDIIRANESISDLAFSTAQDKKNKKKKKKEEQKRQAELRKEHAQQQAEEKKDPKSIPEISEATPDQKEKPSEAKSKESKELKETKEAEAKEKEKDKKDKKDKETKETKEAKEAKESKEAKEAKEAKELKETKDLKEVKETKGEEKKPDSKTAKKKAAEEPKQNKPDVKVQEEVEISLTSEPENLKANSSISRPDGILESISTNETTVESKKSKKKKKKNKQAQGNSEDQLPEESYQLTKDNELIILEEGLPQDEAGGKPDIQLSKSKKKKLKKKAKQQALHEALERAENEVKQYEQEYGSIEKDIDFEEFKAYVQNQEFETALRMSTAAQVFDRFGYDDDKLTVKLHYHNDLDDLIENATTSTTITTKKKKKKKKTTTLNFPDFAESLVDEFEYQPNFYPSARGLMGSSSINFGTKREDYGNDKCINLETLDHGRINQMITSEMPVHKLIEIMEKNSFDYF